MASPTADLTALTKTVNALIARVTSLEADTRVASLQADIAQLKAKLAEHNIVDGGTA